MSLKWSIPSLMVARTAPFDFLLDRYTGATAAFSMYKLSSTYSGNCLRVRRDSDNTEQNIGFVNNFLDTASLQTFVGSNSGYIVTWYDQSGNTNDATQVTAVNQPRIINVGTLDTYNGKARYRTLGGSLMTLPVPSISGNSTVNTYMVNDYIFGNNINLSGSNSLNRYLYTAEPGNGSTTLYENSGTPSMYVNNSVFSGTTRGDVATSLANDKVININFDASSWSYCWPFGYNFGAYLGDNMVGEIIFWLSDQSSNRSGIFSNINTRWGVY